MLVLPAELTHAEAPTCLNMLLQAARAERSSELLVDAAPLARFDSSALAVLLECRRECLRDGRAFAVKGFSPRLAQLAALYGVDTLLTSPAGVAAGDPAPAAA